MSRVRKAFVSGAGAAVAAFAGAWVKGGAPVGAQGWGAMLGSAVAAGLVVGLGTWRVPNAEPAR